MGDRFHRLVLLVAAVRRVVVLADFLEALALDFIGLSPGSAFMSTDTPAKSSSSVVVAAL